MARTRDPRSVAAARRRCGRAVSARLVGGQRRRGQRLRRPERLAARARSAAPVGAPRLPARSGRRPLRRAHPRRGDLVSDQARPPAHAAASTLAASRRCAQPPEPRTLDSRGPAERRAAGSGCAGRPAVGRGVRGGPTARGCSWRWRRSSWPGWRRSRGGCERRWAGARPAPRTRVSREPRTRLTAVAPPPARAPVDVVGYIAVARAAERDRALDTAAQSIGGWCESRGWQLTRIVHDVEPASGRITDRPGLAYVLDQIASGQRRGHRPRPSRRPDPLGHRARAVPALAQPVRGVHDRARLRARHVDRGRRAGRRRADRDRRLGTRPDRRPAPAPGSRRSAPRAARPRAPPRCATTPSSAPASGRCETAACHCRPSATPSTPRACRRCAAAPTGGPPASRRRRATSARRRSRPRTRAPAVARANDHGTRRRWDNRT